MKSHANALRLRRLQFTRSALTTRRAKPWRWRATATVRRATGARRSGERTTLKATFAVFPVLPLSSVARTEVVKFLLDLEDERAVWFIDTERYEIHYFFARDHLSSSEHPVEDHAAFNVREYRREDRRFEFDG